MYWTTSHEKFQRHHFFYDPNDGLGGFSVLLEDEVEIVDPAMDHYVIKKDDYGMDMFVHKAAYSSGEFFVNLVNHDTQDEVKQLFQNMRNMGLDPNLI